MHRCYIEPEQWQPGTVALGRDESRHLLQVLRVEKGDALTVFNGEGEVADATLVSADAHEALVEIGTIRCIPPPTRSLTLIQGLPRTQRMDLIVQKAVELGIHRIIPLFTRHALVRWKPAQAEAKRERWQRIALNAAKQSGNPRLIQIDLPRAFTDWADDAPLATGPVLFGSLHREARPLKETIKTLHEQAPNAVSCLVGPEGDFSREELDRIHQLGLLPVTLGAQVLRSETAALYMMTVLAYEWGPEQEIRP